MNKQPPRLAIALLKRFVPDSEPLQGDLIEDFEIRQSRTWLWTQVIAALAASARRRSDEIRPLRLLDGPVSRTVPLRTYPARSGPVNLTASPVAGIGGLGILAIVLLVTLGLPEAWWVALLAAAAGVACGVILIAIERARVG